jgi:transposase-like protein
MPDLICPICEEPIPGNSEYGYRENGIQRPSCKDCWRALMNIRLLQILNQYRRGDPRALLRQELGIKGKYQEVGKNTK